MAGTWEWITAVAAAPFIGSFLATLAVRLPRGEDVVATPSHCRACGVRLAPRDLVPLVSFALARGRCHACGARVDFVYPLVELAAVGVALWAGTVMEGALFWVTCGLGWTLVALAAMDMRDMVLSDVLTLPLTAAGLIAIAVIDPASVPDHLIGAAAGFAALAAVALVYRRVRGRDGLGWGDAKLFAAAGAWTSWTALGGVLLIAAAATLAAAVVRRLLGREVGAKSALALGPGLALGFWVTWLYGPVAFG